MKLLPARTTAVQREALDQAGPIGAGVRAILWLGLAASGQPLPPAARREVLSLLAEDLAPGVLAALGRLADQLLGREGQAVVASAVSAAPPPALMPYASEHTEAPPLAGRAAPVDNPYVDMGVEYDG